MDDQCKTCKFWSDLNFGDNLGECRANPPLVNIPQFERAHAEDGFDYYHDLHCATLFPVTLADEYCRAHLPKSPP